MAATTTIDSVTTTDAAPTVAPHRISAITGEDVASVKLTPTTPDSSPIRAIRLLFNTTNRKGVGGKVLMRAGAVCGLDVCGPNTRSLSLPSGTQRTVPVAYASLPTTPDGDYTVTGVSASDTQSWG